MFLGVARSASAFLGGRFHLTLFLIFFIHSPGNKTLKIKALHHRGRRGAARYTEKGLETLRQDIMGREFFTE